MASAPVAVFELRRGENRRVRASADSGAGGQSDATFADTAPQGATIGTGQVKAALILPLTAPGNAGVAGQAMRNAAEMAIAEFSNPNIQLLVKDDGGTAQAAQLAAQQSL